MEKSRVNIRLDSSVWHQIDLQRSERAGFISRNTWIEEAVKEKLAKDEMQIVNREYMSNASFS